jgi:hypothetical protein
MLLTTDHLPTALVRLACTVQVAVLSPDVLRMRRLVAGEAARSRGRCSLRR